VSVVFVISFLLSGIEAQRPGLLARPANLG
jgi:hypothetical protein